MSVRWGHPADLQVPRFPGFQIARRSDAIRSHPGGVGAAHGACVGTWKSGILKTCGPARRGAAPVGAPAGSAAGVQGAPEWPAAGQSGAGHGTPHGAGPALRLGRAGSVLAGRVDVKPRAVQPVGAAICASSGIIKSTFNDGVTSSTGSPRPCGPSRARPEILYADVRDGRSQLLRASSAFRLSAGVANETLANRWTECRATTVDHVDGSSTPRSLWTFARTQR
jgi:hypothetical protein